MDIIFGYENVFLENMSLALGFFDSMHLGHQKVVSTAVNFAKKFNLKSAVVTFRENPSIFFGKQIKNVLPFDKRMQHFEKIGCNFVVVIDFDEKFSQLSSEEYIKFLHCHFKPRFITTGFNHFFGKNRTGSGKTLKDHEFLGWKYFAIAPEKIEGTVISSTLIRRFIQNGEIEKANCFLGYDFYVEGEVLKGNQIARKLGFATANILPNKNCVSPPFGVYVANVEIENEKMNAIVNFGTKPTFFDNLQPVFEAHIFNFSKNIYNKLMKINFISKIRDEKKFSSPQNLQTQIEKDIISAKKLLKLT